MSKQDPPNKVISLSSRREQKSGMPGAKTNSKRQANTRVVAITSGKGGVGKTNVSVNLAVAMSDAGQRVMLLDADLGLANVDVLLGLQPECNLSHVIDGERTLEEIILTGPAGIMVVPAASG